MNRLAIALGSAMLLAAGATVLFAAGAAEALAQDAKMSFFVTSEGPGDGANLGGLAGAGGKTWRAYLSAGGVNARDRIGAGPWYNVKGMMIAASVADLHGDANKIDKQMALTEKGTTINGRGDQPNMHDMLTGTNPDGTASDKTCGDWTSNGEGSAIVGHHDRIGLRDDAPSKSWNSSHGSRGCGQDALRSTGGNGLFYCFAAN